MLQHEIDSANAILSDQLVEIRSLDDPEWGDPAEWGPEWDEDVWELGPVITPDAMPLPPELEPGDEPESFEPDTVDREWAAGNVSADEAEMWSDYREWAEHMDRLDATRRALDAAYEARCRFG
jgi:hypothetical protein